MNSNSEFHRPNKGVYKRREVPHWDFADATQHISFRLSDSLSQNQLEKFKKQAEQEPPFLQNYYLHRDIEEWINRGSGTCILKIPELARTVIDALLLLNDKRYHLFQWVIMPNHMHILMREFSGNPMCDVVQSWKHFTCERFDTILQNIRASSRFRPGYIDSIINTFNGHYWMIDFWDVFIRNSKHFELESKYIAENPVKAGLVQRPEDYPWSSFYRGY